LQAPCQVKTTLFAVTFRTRCDQACHIAENHGAAGGRG
jgi:hypothetical protein